MKNKEVKYYILLLLGLFMISSFIWIRFLRERVLRHIPDLAFTELRFWIIISLCISFIWILKRLIRPKPIPEAILLLKEVFPLNKLKEPLVVLDHLIKYNKYTKKDYYSLIKVLTQLIMVDFRITALYYLHLYPRIFLALCLVIDTFYFHCIEIFYKVLLIGIIPLLYTYYKYSLKDLYKHYEEILEANCGQVLMFGLHATWTLNCYNDKMVYHNKLVTIQEYVSIRTHYENLHFDEESEEMHFYKGYIMPKGTLEFNDDEETYDEEQTADWNYFETVHHKQVIFSCLYPYQEMLEALVDLKTYAEDNDFFAGSPLFRKYNIMIYAAYLICWSYILFRSMPYLDDMHTTLDIIQRFQETIEPFSNTLLFN